jgi:hypothetical protein
VAQLVVVNELFVGVVIRCVAARADVHCEIVAAVCLVLDAAEAEAENGAESAVAAGSAHFAVNYLAMTGPEAAGVLAAAGTGSSFVVAVLGLDLDLDHAAERC